MTPVGLPLSSNAVNLVELLLLKNKCEVTQLFPCEMAIYKTVFSCSVENI